MFKVRFPPPGLEGRLPNSIFYTSYLQSLLQVSLLRFSPSLLSIPLLRSSSRSALHAREREKDRGFGLLIFFSSCRGKNVSLLETVV